MPPEITRKIKKWQYVNLGFTMLQLACSIAIISIVSNQLTIVRSVALGPTSGKWSYSCFMATDQHPSTCQYAYSVASVSIFAGFIVSLMQCLTVDCCGMGRIVESVFDSMAAIWWIAGASTLTTRAREANDAGVPNQSWRDSVVALSWVAGGSFAVLCFANLMLVQKLGKAYKEVKAQQQAAAAGALPPGAYGVQMVPTAYPTAPPAAGAPVAQLPAGYPPGPGAV